jgi:hypothetical protein
LNPRPQVLRHKVYMLISLFNLADDYPSSQENHQRFRKVLAHPHRSLSIVKNLPFLASFESSREL